MEALIKELELLADSCDSNYAMEMNAYNRGVLDSISVMCKHLKTLQSEKAELIKNINELCEDLAHNESHEVRTFLRKIDELLTKING